MEIQPPEKFIRLCEEVYHISPATLALALVYEFCRNPPRHLILVERAERQESEAHH